MITKSWRIKKFLFRQKKKEEKERKIFVNNAIDTVAFFPPCPELVLL